MNDLHERAQALLAAADKMTESPWTWGQMYICEKTEDGYNRLAQFPGTNPAPEEHQWEDDAAGIVALRNEAPALIRELLAENERLEAVREATARMCMDEQDENERLRARVAELEAARRIPDADVGWDAGPDEHVAVDAGPTEFRGRKTRRQE